VYHHASLGLIKALNKSESMSMQLSEAIIV